MGKIKDETWIKKLPDGNAVGVRLDKGNFNLPSHFGGHYPHAHKDIISPSTSINSNVYYLNINTTTTYDDQNVNSTDLLAIHIRIAN